MHHLPCFLNIPDLVGCFHIVQRHSQILGKPSVLAYESVQTQNDFQFREVM